MPRPADHRDGGYAWIVLLCCVCVQLLSIGIAFSVGVFYAELLDAFGASKSETALVGSLHTSLLFLPGPAVSLLLQKLSHRTVAILGSITACSGLLAGAFAQNLWTLYLTYGALGGVGLCMAFVSAVTLPAEYFSERRNLAFALGAAGGGLGTLVLPQAAGLLVDALTWRGALIALAGLALQMTAIAALLRPPPPAVAAERRPPRASAPSLLVLSVCLSRPFVALRLNSFLFNFGDLILFVLIADYGVSRGAIGESDGRWLLSLVGLLSAVGRLTVAAASAGAECRRCRRPLLYVAACGLSGLAIGAVPLRDGFYYWSACSAAFGLLFGVQLANYAIVTAEVMGADRFELAYGLLMMTDGLGALAGPPFAGWLYSMFGGYEAGFYAGAAAKMAAALVLLPTAIGCCPAREASADERRATSCGPAAASAADAARQRDDAEPEPNVAA